jgi:serine/threonine protein kinase
MGTPYYMSPEQARGERNLDGRVDIYACGVLLYEAVTSRRPFIANNYNSLLLQILTAKPPSPRELRPNLPVGVERIIEKAMARRREDRFANAAEFIHELARLREAQVGGVMPFMQRPGGTGSYSSPRNSPAPPPHPIGSEPPGARPTVMRAQHTASQSASRPQPPPVQPPRPPSVELPSELLGTASSVDVPVVFDARPPPAAPSRPMPPSALPPVHARPVPAPPPVGPRPRGFEDMPTEVGVRDFSASEEGEATTALLKDEEVAALARNARRNYGSEDEVATTLIKDEEIARLTRNARRNLGYAPKTKPGELPSFDVNNSSVTKTEPLRRKTPFDAEQTEKMPPKERKGR